MRARQLAPILQRPWGPGLIELDVGDSPLGDAGIATLAKVLPSTLQELRFSSTGCGDEGYVAMAAAFRALTSLKILQCSWNGAGPGGWTALAAALPPSLTELLAYGSGSMGLEGAKSLAAAVPRLLLLEDLLVGVASEEAKAVLQAVERPGLSFEVEID